MICVNNKLKMADLSLVFIHYISTLAYFINNVAFHTIKTHLKKGLKSFVFTLIKLILTSLIPIVFLFGLSLFLFY